MAHRRTIISLLSAILASGAAAPALAQTISLADLAGKTHVHGLSFDPADSANILVATHHGVMRAAPDGNVTPVSDVQDDFMGFVPHPTDPSIIFGSGHPSTGGNLGFIKSTDAGKTWTKIAPGVDGPVDFHQLAVSLTDANVFYGSYGSIQTSRDGGATWTIAGEAPGRLIDIAISPADPATVYAATETGLMVSRDGAKTWQTLVSDVPVTTVELTADGTIYAFAPGRGVLRASEAAPSFNTIGEGPDAAGYILHLAADRKDKQRLVAITGDKVIMVSSDAGVSWKALGKN